MTASHIHGNLHVDHRGGAGKHIRPLSAARLAGYFCVQRCEFSFHPPNQGWRRTWRSAPLNPSAGANRIWFIGLAKAASQPHRSQDRWHPVEQCEDFNGGRVGCEGQQSLERCLGPGWMSAALKPVANNDAGYAQSDNWPARAPKRLRNFCVEMKWRADHARYTYRRAHCHKCPANSGTIARAR